MVGSGLQSGMTDIDFNSYLRNLTQQSTNNAQNEYKYVTVFVLQKKGLTTFLQKSKKIRIVSINKTEFLE